MPFICLFVCLLTFSFLYKNWFLFVHREQRRFEHMKKHILLDIPTSCEFMPENGAVQTKCRQLVDYEALA